VRGRRCRRRDCACGRGKAGDGAGCPVLPEVAGIFSVIRDTGFEANKDARRWPGSIINNRSNNNDKIQLFHN